MSASFDPTREDAPKASDSRMSYGDYLELDRLLDVQRPLSSAHDEMLFIIQHQTSELWMKLAIYEIQAARRAIAGDELQSAFKTLSRVSRILEQLTSAWEVLRTMTPDEFASFRDDLGQSSGLQSYQYREIEYLLGNRNKAMLRTYADRPAILSRLEEELARPSLYDEALRLLDRNDLDLPSEVLRRDVSLPYLARDEVLEAWRSIYSNPERHRPLYDLAEKLVDLEDHFRRWRFNHVTTVERIIGLKRGTGGTGGATYLRKMLDVELFPELWRVRTIL